MPNQNHLNLYSDALKKQAQRPFGLNKSINKTHGFEGYNASCGDELSVFIELCSITNTIKDISFKTESCAICRASASLLCQSVIKSNKESVENIANQLTNQLTSQSKLDSNIMTDLNLDLLYPVSRYPSRINCALLPWQTLISTFDNKV